MSSTPHPVTADANTLVEEHLYLVQHIVNQLAVRYPRHVDRQELWAAGAAGLVDASRRYDAETGVSSSPGTRASGSGARSSTRHGPATGRHAACVAGRAS